MCGEGRNPGRASWKRGHGSPPPCLREAKTTWVCPQVTLGLYCQVAAFTGVQGEATPAEPVLSPSSPLPWGPFLPLPPPGVWRVLAAPGQEGTLRRQGTWSKPIMVAVT